MAVNKKALNIELLKFAGFTCTGGIWTYPDGVDVDNGVPFFPGSFDECLKWIIKPKLRYISLHYDSKLKFLISVDGGEDMGVATADGDDAAMALCLAIKELMK